MSMSDKKCQYQSTVLRTDFKQTKMLIFFLEVGNEYFTNGTFETVPKIGNVWERGATWHNGITIHHAFQNAKRIRKWYSTVLLLYFLRILLLSSCLPFAFCVFLMIFDIFWFRYSCILSVLWPMSPVWQNVNINVRKKTNKKRAAIFKTGNVWERRVKWNRSFSLFFCSFVFLNIFLGTLMDHGRK